MDWAVPNQPAKLCTFHTLQWVWGRNWQLQYISVSGLKLWQSLLDGLTGICCNEVTQVLVNGATVVVICTLGNSGIQVNVVLRSATPVRTCRVGIMSRWSLDLSVTSVTCRTMTKKWEGRFPQGTKCSLCPLPRLHRRYHNLYLYTWLPGAVNTGVIYRFCR